MTTDTTTAINDRGIVLSEPLSIIERVRARRSRHARETLWLDSVTEIRSALADRDFQRSRDVLYRAIRLDAHSGAGIHPASPFDPTRANRHAMDSEDTGELLTQCMLGAVDNMDGDYAVFLTAVLECHICALEREGRIDRT